MSKDSRRHKTPTPLAIRRAVEADVETLADIHLAARQAASMPRGIHSDAEVRSWISHVTLHNPTWVAEMDGQTVGYVRCEDATIEDLYVLPLYQGAGVGSALLDFVKSQRPGGFTLWVFQENAPAITFYRRHGLAVLETTDGSHNEEKAPDMRMGWLAESKPKAL